METKIKCRFCKSENIIKKGFRKTKNLGKIQKYFCKNCNKFFVEDNGFLKMKNSPQKVTLCLDLFFKGISTRQIQQHLQAFYPHNSSHMTIYRWIVKYSKLISTFTDNLKLNVGRELQIDEMEIGSQKSRYKGWFIDSIDTKTRFMVSSAFKKNRDLKEVSEVLKNAKNKTENQFEVITSDGWLAYPQAIQKTFVLKEKSNTRKYGVVHNKVNASQGEGFNYKIERLHNSVRHRIKTFRGFHGSTESANSIMKGYEIYYNFIRKHLALGKCPYELATDLKLENENKWLKLIDLSNKQ
jgi:putative transposase